MPAHASHAEDPHDIAYPQAVPFVIFHLLALGAIWSGVTVQALVVCGVVFVVRMFVVTAGYHRYFSHRAFRTSRAGQFVLAFLAQTAAQRGVVWWAAKHRAHHKHSDTELDPHSPVQRGFWFAHVGWIFAPKTVEADYTYVPDLMKYPELMWLDRQKYLPAMILGLAIFVFFGWPGLFVGFFGSTVILYHASFTVNSIAHQRGSQRYVTGDDSRNNWYLALLTLGEGWHNNHHHYQSSTRQGFFWWEVDVTYYILKFLSLFRIVWDLREPPRTVVHNEQRLRGVVVEKVARQLAATFCPDRIAAQIREAWDGSERLSELGARMREARSRAEAALALIELPEVPSLAELRERAEEMFEHSPSLDDIVERAREVLAHAVSVRLFAGPLPATA